MADLITSYIFSIISILSLLFCIVLVIDYTIFSQKMKAVKYGMTGKEIQDATGMQIIILKVNKNTYYARMCSKLTVFKYRLIFLDGKLMTKQRG